jgi:hypothetical protein
MQALISLQHYDLALGYAVAALRVARGRHDCPRAWYQAAVCCRHACDPYAALYFLKQVHL